MRTVSSPCIQVCQLSPDNVCYGCGRTLQQITDWAKYSEPERLRIMAELKQKK